MSSKKRKKKQGLLLPRRDTYYIDAIGPKNNEAKISLPIPAQTQLDLLDEGGWYE
jgi:hypothetical protein